MAYQHSRTTGPQDPAKRETLKKLAALGALAFAGGSLSSCARRLVPSASRERKVIVVGLDGIDPGIVSRLMARGLLPNMSRLQGMGGFRRLASTIPPQSPVAWATFITGQDPGRHGIYDFLHRDPKTAELLPSITRKATDPVCLPLGGWRVPVWGSRLELQRRGRAFWEILCDEGVPCEIYRVPSNFPPRDNGARQLAGLGTPDLSGANSKYHYFHEGHAGPDVRPENGIITQVQVVDGCARTRLCGPHNRLVRDAPVAKAEFHIWLDREHRLAKIAVQGEEVVLRQGEWSDWVGVRFPLLPHLKSAAGICRFYLKQVSPTLKLYVTPINLSPFDPFVPIAAPAGFAQELAEREGPYHTAGLPEDTAALLEGVLTDDEYLQQSSGIMEEARRMYESALNHFQRGLLFHYFGTTDRTQHMFWRSMDPRHRAYTPRLAKEHGGVIEDCYREADEVIGQALDACHGQTTLLVLSDHGFAPFYRRFHLNAWLVAKGYLVTRKRRGQETLADADWAKTRAYSIGLTALYLNLQGREGQGAVAPADARALAHQIARDLEAERDPVTGDRVVARAYITADVYSAVIPDLTPDIIVGCARGYRCSSSSGMGATGGPVLDDNTQQWSGDHCIDAAAVPGVLFSTKPLGEQRPGLWNLAGSILDEFGVTIPKELPRRTVWS